MWPEYGLTGARGAQPADPVPAPSSVRGVAPGVLAGWRPPRAHSAILTPGALCCSQLSEIACDAFTLVLGWSCSSIFDGECVIPSSRSAPEAFPPPARSERSASGQIGMRTGCRCITLEQPWQTPTISKTTTPPPDPGSAT